jgi:hypothetical protein
MTELELGAESLENPTFELDHGTAGAPQLQALDIEAALADGTLSAEQALLEVRKQMRGEMAELEARLTGAGAAGGAPPPYLTAVVHGIVARLTEAPANYHQAVVFAAVSNTRPGGRSDEGVAAVDAAVLGSHDTGAECGRGRRAVWHA